MANPRLSAVIITYNEEGNIGRCLESLVPVVDEIVVVDAFSTDGTGAVVEKFGKARLFRHEWQGYSESKNFGNGKAIGDFILSIDADEALSPELQNSVRAALSGGPSSDTIFEVTRLTCYCGKWIYHSGWYPERKIRIFARDSASWKGALHEELVFSGQTRKVRLAGHLLHYSFPTVESHIHKMIKYATLAAEKDIAAGKSYSLLLYGLLKPWYVFVRKYFLQAGFLDGFYGLVIAINAAYEKFLRYVKYRQLKP